MTEAENSEDFKIKHQLKVDRLPISHTIPKICQNFLILKLKATAKVVFNKRLPFGFSK